MKDACLLSHLVYVHILRFVDIHNTHTHTHTQAHTHILRFVDIHTNTHTHTHTCLGSWTLAMQGCRLNVTHTVVANLRRACVFVCVYVCVCVLRLVDRVYRFGVQG
jgi:hypothetical protein